MGRYDILSIRSSFSNQHSILVSFYYFDESHEFA